MNSEINAYKIQNIRVIGEGDTRQQAFASALANIRKEIIGNDEQVTLQIIPEKIRVLHAECSVYQEKFLFFFFPRKRTRFHLTLDIDAKLNFIDLGHVDFKIHHVPSPDRLKMPNIKKLLRGES